MWTRLWTGLWTSKSLKIHNAGATLSRARARSTSPVRLCKGRWRTNSGWKGLRATPVPYVSHGRSGTARLALSGAIKGSAVTAIGSSP